MLTLIYSRAVRGLNRTCLTVFHDCYRGPGATFQIWKTELGLASIYPLKLPLFLNFR